MVVAGTSTGNYSLTVSVNGGALQTAANIPFAATPATVQADLAALTNVGASNVIVTGTTGNYTITFNGALLGSTIALTTAVAGGTTITSTAVGSAIGTGSLSVGDLARHRPTWCATARGRDGSNWQRLRTPLRSPVPACSIWARTTNRKPLTEL